MYFYYGITHSTLENPSEEIELTVDQTYLQPQPPANNDHHQTTAVWDRHGYENKMADDSWSQSNFGTNWTSKPAKTNETSLTWGDERTSNGRSNQQSNSNSQQSAAKPQGGFGIFVDETQFPSWDD